MGCPHRAPCLGSLLPGDVPGADSVWAGAEGSGSLPPRSPGPLFPLPRRPALRLSSRSLARALCSSNNLIRFPRPPIEMRLTSACTRACGPSEAIPDLDLGEQGPVLVAHTLFLSQDSPQRVTEKGPPREDAAWSHRAEGFSLMRSFQKLQAGRLRPRNRLGLPPGSAENPHHSRSALLRHSPPAPLQQAFPGASRRSRVAGGGD